MPRDDAVVALTERTRGLHVLELAHHQHLSANDARHARPADHADGHEHHAERRLERRDKRDQQQQRWKRERDVREAHHELIHPFAVVTGDESECQSEESAIPCERKPTESEMRAP